MEFAAVDFALEPLVSLWLGLAVGASLGFCVGRMIGALVGDGTALGLTVGDAAVTESSTSM